MPSSITISHDMSRVPTAEAGQKYDLLLLLATLRIEEGLPRGCCWGITFCTGVGCASTSLTASSPVLVRTPLAHMSSLLARITPIFFCRQLSVDFLTFRGSQFDGTPIRTSNVIFSIFFHELECCSHLFKSLIRGQLHNPQWPVDTGPLSSLRWINMLLVLLVCVFSRHNTFRAHTRGHRPSGPEQQPYFRAWFSPAKPQQQRLAIFIDSKVKTLFRDGIRKAKKVAEKQKRWMGNLWSLKTAIVRVQVKSRLGLTILCPF